MDRSEAIVAVEILGRSYPIRSRLDPEYVARLAAFVNDRMRAAAETTATDTVHAAVLAALNIADELFRTRDAPAGDATPLIERAQALELLLDEALESPPLAARERAG
jgi:cell division protein ZapA